MKVKRRDEMNKKVAFIGIKGLPSMAGVDRVVEAIIFGLDKRLYEPTVYCSSRVTPKDLKFDEIKMVRIPALKGKYLHALSLYLFSALHALVFGKYDLIHLHNVEASLVLPILRLRYKTVSTSHAAVRGIGKWGKKTQMLLSLSERWFINLSNCRTSVSFPDSVDYKQKYGVKVHYIPNGVNNEIRRDKSASTEILSQNGVNAGEYILFAAGRIVPAKGCHILLEAFRKLSVQNPLIIVGDFTHVPEYTQELKQLADERVKFVPFISAKEKLFGLIETSLLFVYPTTFEGMSVMLLEVASLGTPLICSDIPANRNCLPEQTLFFKSEDSDDLASKLSWALNNPQQMKTLAESTKNFVYTKYDWKPIVQKYEQLYNDLLDRNIQLN